MNEEIDRLFAFIIGDDNVVCTDGMEWLKYCSTLDEVWLKCPRADWMVLNIGRMGYSDQFKIRKFIYYLMTELTVKDGKNILDMLSNQAQYGAIDKLRDYIDGKNNLDAVREAGLKVWASRADNDDVNIVVATACMWSDARGAIMAAKAMLGRINALADSEIEVEKRAADILRECVDLNSVLDCYRNYIKEKIHG